MRGLEGGMHGAVQVDRHNPRERPQGRVPEPRDVHVGGEDAVGEARLVAMAEPARHGRVEQRLGGGERAGDEAPRPVHAHVLSTRGQPEHVVGYAVLDDGREARRDGPRERPHARALERRARQQRRVGMGLLEEFEDRRTTKMVEGQRVAGWFSEDFTLAELRTLRARERVPMSRPDSAQYNGLYQVPTFEEIVKLVRAKEYEVGRPIGLYPELKHPTLMLEQEGIDMVDLFVTELEKFGLTGADANVFVQIFEVGPLQRLNKLVDTPLVLLISAEGGPYDEPAMRWADIITPAGLAEVALYADGIGPWLGHVVDPATMQPTALVANAHAAGLKVHPWTLRKENGFLPGALRGPGSDADDGRYAALWSAALASGADGFFTDNVKELVELVGE